MSREVDYPERPSSEQLVDLHVYVVPPDLWRDHLNSAINTIINDTVSAGFVRVWPESTVYTLREELEQQLGYDIIPRDYVFLKSVGRCLTRIRPKQEFQLKAKNFLPPLAYVPEVFLLEASPEYLSSYPSSGVPSGRNSRLDTGPGEFNPHRPVPPIRTSQQGFVRNSQGSTAGTQTGQSYPSVSPLTQSHIFSSRSKPESHAPNSQIKPSHFDNVTSNTLLEGQGPRRFAPYDHNRHVNQLTPVLGSEPPETARTSPNDHSSSTNNSLHRQGPSQSYSNNTNYGNQGSQGENSTWATRIDPSYRNKNHPNDRDGLGINTSRSEPDPSYPYHKNHTKTKNGRIYGPNGINAASQTDLRSNMDPQYDPYRQNRGLSDITRPVQGSNTPSNNNTNLHTKHSGAADNMDYNSLSPRQPFQQGSRPQSRINLRHPLSQYEESRPNDHPQHHQPNGPYTSQQPYHHPQNSSQNGYQQGQQSLQNDSQQSYYPNQPYDQEQNGLLQQEAEHQKQYQRNLDGGQGNAYEPPLSASPPNSAGLTNVGMKKTSHGQDMNKYNNNTSDDSGISEMDEVDRRRAEDRLQSGIRESSVELTSPSGRSGSTIKDSNIDLSLSPLHGEGSESGGLDEPLDPRGSPADSEGSHQTTRGGSRTGDGQFMSPGATDKRHDLGGLEHHRHEMTEEERRKHQEEEDRWKKWGGQNMEGSQRENAATGIRGQRTDTIQEEEDPLDTLLKEPLDQEELKEKLNADLEEARHERREIEKKREELVKRARALQSKTQQRRAQARDLWKKRYFEEKKKTAPLEEQANKMRQELETLHRKIMSQLEQSKGKEAKKGDKPSQQSNLKIQATKLQHEIEELQRRVENVKMKLTSEMKLRNQAETELRALRAELTQKKINMSLSRSKLSTIQGEATQGMPLTTR